MTGEGLNQAFTIVILTLTVVGLVGTFFRRGMLSRISQAAPGTLTALGVLGTFVGILIGLLDFQVAQIADSVPKLLDGMKTAFVTSVLGIGAGILVKFANEILARREDGGDARGVEDVLQSLAEIRRAVGDGNKEVAASIERTRAALSGDSESSLVTQLQRLRTDTIDEMKVSRKAIDERMVTVVGEIRAISKTLAEDTTETFVKALEAAIKDFNQRITEQFGENFKQLNEAVGRLLQWQEQYRIQMIANAEALREGEQGIAKARTGIEAIAAQSATLVAAADAMRTVLVAIDATRVELETRLAAFASMAQQAGDAFPVIQRNLDGLTRGFATEVEKAIALAAETARSLDTSVSEATGKVSASMAQATAEAARIQAAQSESFKALAKGFETLRDEASAAHDAVQIMIVDAASASQKAAADTARTVTEALQRTTNEEFARIAGSLDGQIKQLDDALQKELTNALSLLGSQLASLSKKFVDDYMPLTERLREVVQLARRVQ